MIQFPNLDINIDEGLDNKEILQQILDAIHKQRKELNFYLMNLNEDNMPTIAGRMEDIEGNISLIDQDIDEILLLVANNAGDIAALSVRADQIQAQVADNAGNISSLSLRADAIETTVANNSGNISQLQQTANSIMSRVAYLEDDFDWAYSEIRQLADEITAKVTIGDVVNYLSINRSGVKIHAQNIDLDGIVRVNRYLEIGNIGDSNTKEITFFSGGGTRSSFISAYMSGGYSNLEIYGSSIDISAWDMIRLSGPVYFPNQVDFGGTVDFTDANVYGLDTDVDTRYLIECYYAANKCYIDYGGGSRLTIRDRYGDVVGYISFD